MTSLEVLHTQNDSGSFPSDDYSLLPEVEAGSVPNGDINLHDDHFNFTNMQSALSGPSSDSSVVEIHSHLNELIEENHRLKDELNTSKSMMEDHITTIQSWRDHMILSKSQLEEHLKMAKEKILSLEKENSELREKIADVIKVNQKDVKSCTQCSSHETGLNTNPTVDFGKRNDCIKQEWGYFCENLPGNLKLVCQSLEAVSAAAKSQEEKLLLDGYISMLKVKIASLKGDVGQLDSLQADEETDYEIVRLKTHEGGSKQFHKVIEELKQKVMDGEKEVASLTNEKEVLNEKIKEQERRIQECEIALKSQYETLNNKLQNETSLSQKYRERCESLQEQIEDYQVKLEQSRTRMSNEEDVMRLKEEIQQLQAILKLEQQAKEADKEKYAEFMKKCENLQVDYERVTKLLEIQTKEDKEKNEKLALSDNDVKKYMEEVDHLTAKLLETEEKLEESDAELKRLQDQLAQINEDTESIPILKAQIELYKTDYNNLESAKNAAADEVERLTTELKKYERNESPRSHSRRNRRSDDERSRSSDEGGATALLVCPICGLGLTTESGLENHVNRCIEENP